MGKEDNCGQRNNFVESGLWIELGKDEEARVNLDENKHRMKRAESQRPKNQLRDPKEKI